MAPLFTVLPAGLIIGNYFEKEFGSGANNIALTILFLGAAFLNYEFVQNQNKITYTEADGNH